MPIIKSIMVAIDFSRYAAPTARYANMLAKDLNAELLFVNVINQRDIDTVQRIMATYDTFNLDNFIKERLRTRHDDLAELIKNSGGDAETARTVVRIGVPYQKLLEVIEEEKPDLLVMATKGRSDLADVVMGSCARIMHRRSPIPVLSIRGDKYTD